MDTERLKGHAAGRRPLPSAVSAMHTESSCVGEETAASLGAQGSSSLIFCDQSAASHFHILEGQKSCEGSLCKGMCHSVEVCGGLASWLKPEITQEANGGGTKVQGQPGLHIVFETNIEYRKRSYLKRGWELGSIFHSGV